MARTSGAFATLTRLPPPTSGDPFNGSAPTLRTILSDLAEACAVRYAGLWLPSDETVPRWAPALVWQARRWTSALPPPEPVDDPDRLMSVEGVVATVDVTDDGIRHGILVLAHRVSAEHRPAPIALIGEAAVGIGLLLRHARHQRATAIANAAADHAVAQADLAHLELSTVQAVERDRLALVVTATAERHLRATLSYADALEHAVHGASTDAETIAAIIRAELHRMIEQFRDVVRGVYPQLLRGSGVRAALEELAAMLPVPVEFGGDLGRRQGWEVESGLFQGAASALAALSVPGDGNSIVVDLRRIERARSGDLLAIRARRSGVASDPVTAALHEDARRLAALGGRLSVRRAPDGGTEVEIRLPERLGGEPAEPHSIAVTLSERSTRGDAGGAPGLLGPAAVRGADTEALRIARDRQDGLLRVVIVGTPAARLVTALRGETATPPMGALPIFYQYGQVARITLDPDGDSPWPPIRIPEWSAVDWPDAAADLHRAVVESPISALRGLRLRHCTDRVDPDLASRLRTWSGPTDGPPDAVVLVLDGPATTAESEFLTMLRAPGGDGFAPLAICALRDGAVVTPGSRQWLATMTDAIVGWHEGDAIAVEETLRTRLVHWSERLAERWALRALQATRSAGHLDADTAHALEAVAAAAYPLADLDLLQALQSRRIRLTRGQNEAQRLLGADGSTPQARLGLAAGAVDVADAAHRALAFWRVQAMSPDSGPDGRSACAQLIRACERLLAAVTDASGNVSGTD